MRGTWELLWQEADRVGGFVTPGVADRAGMSWDTVRARARRERWPAPLPSIVLPPWATFDRITMMAVACSAGGPGTAVTHDTAAMHHEILATDHADQRIHLTVPYGRRGPQAPWIVMHRSRAWDETDVAMHQGVAIATPARALVDVAALLGEADLVARLLSLRQRRALTLVEVRAQVARRPNLSGTRRLRAALRQVDGNDVDSVLELRTLDLLRRAGLEPVPQHPVACPDGRIRHVDLALLDHRIAVECDGWEAHRSRRAHRVDRHRWAQLQLADWRPVWATWRDVTVNPEKFVGHVRDVIASQVRS